MLTDYCSTSCKQGREQLALMLASYDKIKIPPVMCPFVAKAIVEHVAASVVETISPQVTEQTKLTIFDASLAVDKKLNEKATRCAYTHLEFPDDCAALETSQTITESAIQDELVAYVSM